MQAELEKLIASQELEFALLEAQVRNNDVETLLAESDSLQMLYLNPSERRIKELQAERARIERAQLLKKLEATKGLQKTDVMKIERQIAKIERRLEGEREKMESLTLRAPKDGIVVRGRRWPWSEETWNIGDNVWNGRTVAVFPDFGNVKVLIYAQETEYKRIHEGDSVMYTFDAMPDNIGWGRITKLSPVGQTRTEGSAVKTFEIEATVDSLLSPVDPGLSVQCRVFLRYVPDTIVVPTISIFDRDSMKVVYVEHAGRYEERLVTLGEGSPRSTIISKGLKPGERIALVKPKND
jgi:multidrug efflux pump subunit AcrA (membrane-fusion protein)